MLPEENELLTQTGPGKSCGELLRRYWQPIGFANELQDKPKRKRISFAEAFKEAKR